MNTAVRLPLSAANPAIVRDLQEKYPNAELHVVTSGAAAELPSMNEDRFWDILALLDWSKAGNDDAVIEPAIRRLAMLPETAILSFYDLMAEKLYLLDGRTYATNSVKTGDSISADLFLYARCCVVANGRVFYENVMSDPTAFPKDLFFEGLLDIPEHAWLRKTGSTLEHLPKYNYETGFNPSGWGADTITL